eukprot:2069815-Amphidinium_carterae.1
MTIVPLWVHTSQNPADDPTRSQRVRKAKERGSEEAAMIERAAEDHPMAAFCMRFREREGGMRKEYDDTLGYPGEGPFALGKQREA